MAMKYQTGMIQMGRESYKNITWIKTYPVIFLVFLGLSLTVSAQAKQENSYVHLDELTMTRGFTNTLADLSVGVQPDTFNQAAGFLVRKRQAYENVPEYLNLVSDVYSYKIDLPGVGYFEKPIWLSYNYEKDPKYQRNFYYYDGSSQWVKLPTTLDTVNDQVRAAWHFPYSIVAIFDDTRNDVGPSKIATFSDFGGIDAAGAIAIDESTGAVLYEHNAHAKRSIASLTKLMTAYVLIQEGTDLDRDVFYHSRYDQIGARLRMNEGEILSMKDLMYAMTVGSANNAAYALVDNAGYAKAEFVQLMNQTAGRLGLSDTNFADPSGLDPNNTSTPADYAKFMRAILRDADMLNFTTTSSYSFITRNTGEYHGFNNTNSLMRTSDLYITGSKTGYLDEALYCLALKTKQYNHEVITVVLGSPSGSARFSESERLMKWALANYDWQ